MSIFRYFAAAIVLLAAPTAAHAASPGVVPWGTTFCDPVQCATPQPGTPERWTFEWGQITPGVTQVRVTGGWQQTYVFSRFHPNRSNHPWQTITQLTFFGDDGSSSAVYGASIKYTPELNTVQCGTLNYADTLQGEPRVDGAGPGVTTTPAVLHGCFPTVWDEAGHWIPTTTSPPTTTEPVSSSPAKLQSCPAIVVKKKRVAVTSTGLQCSSARNVLARYMTKGIEPSGWVCSKLAVGRARSATCGTPGRSAKRIVGRWRL